ncbi:HLH-domain-containing protein, partial [Ascoidea rubescens DSM 1968]
MLNNKVNSSLPSSNTSGIKKKEKSSHNMIEKRYRTNINDKIRNLRDSVPSLRCLIDDNFDDSNLDLSNDLNIKLDGLQPAKKLNKATILSKATEYIKHLEFKNKNLVKENNHL